MIIVFEIISETKFNTIQKQFIFWEIHNLEKPII